MTTYWKCYWNCSNDLVCIFSKWITTEWWERILCLVHRLYISSDESLDPAEQIYQNNYSNTSMYTKTGVFYVHVYWARYQKTLVSATACIKQCTASLLQKSTGHISDVPLLISRIYRVTFMHSPLKFFLTYQRAIFLPSILIVTALCALLNFFFSANALTCLSYLEGGFFPELWNVQI